MNKQDSEPADRRVVPATGSGCRRRTPKGEAVRLAWHRAGLDTDFGVLISEGPGAGQPVAPRRLATDPDAGVPRQEARGS